MKILNFHRYHRPDCNKCKNHGYYYLYVLPSIHIKTQDPFRMSKKMSNDPKKVYCKCEWGQELKKMRKEIENLPYGNPLKKLSDDEIIESIKPLNPTPFQLKSKEEIKILHAKNWKLAYENYLKSHEQWVYDNKVKRHY
jgi:hypothetical protein